jgi:hypothetical protein
VIVSRPIDLVGDGVLEDEVFPGRSVHCANVNGGVGRMGWLYIV